MARTPLQSFAGILLAIAFGLTLFSPPIKPGKYPSPVVKALWAGNDPFIAPGAEFEAFKSLLPPGEKVSFLLDFPFNPYVPNIDRLYSAQSYLAPRVLSHDPGERAAIVFCSNEEIAQKRLAQEGYQMLVNLGDGKGVAMKVAQ